MGFAHILRIARVDVDPCRAAGYGELLVTGLLVVDGIRVEPGIAEFLGEARRDDHCLVACQHALDVRVGWPRDRALAGGASEPVVRGRAVLDDESKLRERDTDLATPGA